MNAQRDSPGVWASSAQTIPSYRVDLSSDTQTRPTNAMRRHMCSAPVGDEQKREDPTVLELEDRVAHLTGKEAALFLPSGTMCNIIAFFLHCRPGDEVLTQRYSHVVYGELDGPAVHARVGLRLFEGNRGIVEPLEVERSLTEVRPYGGATRVRLLSLENTHNFAGGTVWPLNTQQEVCAVARRHGVAAHLDGARLLNAVAAARIPAADYCSSFDSAWIDLTKGLGCPAGAVLAGESRLIDDARDAKKLFGGAMRQVGILAAAGIYALEHHVERLADDHKRARRLAQSIAMIDSSLVDVTQVETNIVHIDISTRGVTAMELLRQTARHGVRFGYVNPSTIRLVTHLDVSDEHLPLAVSALRTGLDDCDPRRRAKGV
jgi:threonine aldolase